MFFNKARLLAFASIFLLSACSGEKESGTTPVAPSFKNGGDCLGQLGDKLSDYFNARLSVAETEAFWNCTTDAVGDFRKITTGSLPSGNYTPEAIGAFLHRYFLKDSPIPAPVLHELMQVKRILVNGTNDEVSEAELLRIQDLLMELKAFSVEIHPYVGVLFHSKKAASDREIAAAARAFQKALERISAWLTRNGQSYEVAHLQDFVRELSAWLKPDDGSEGSLETIRKLSAVFPQAKRILLGGDAQVIAGSEWAPLIKSAGEVFHVYLSVVHGLDADLDVLLTSESLPASVKDAVQTLRRAVDTRSEKEIPVGEWRELLSGLVATGILPEDFTADSLVNIWQWLLERPLGQAPGKGLGLAQVNLLDARLDEWLDLRAKGTAVKFPDLDALPGKFARNLRSSPPLSWDARGRMVITPDGQPSQWTDAAVKHMVWPYVILDMLKTAYAGADADLLTSDQFQLAVEEVLPLLQGFGWMKDSETTIFKRILREADLFTMASNGNEVLDMSEAVRYLTFVVSAYRAADIWLDQVKTLPCDGLQADCVRAAAKNLELGILDSMPRLKANMSARPLSHFIKYMKQDEEILFGAPKDEEISVGDLLQIWDLFQYVETFIQRYDTDLSDTINLTEAATSFTTYGPTLTVLLEPVGMPSSDIEPFYTFMMKFGDTPFTMWGGSIAFNYWKWHADEWSFEAERTTLMSILNQLSKL